MTEGGNKLLAGFLTGGFIAIYALIAHYSSARADVGQWALILALVPVLLAAIGFARRSVGGALPWVVLATCAGLLLWAWPRLQGNVSWLYLAQHVGVNGALGLLFGRTLIAPRQPLCTFLAEKIQGRMTPLVARYTRQVTQAWTVFFFATVLISLGLFWLAPVEVWSVFANLLTFPLVGLMFIAENVVRKRILPPEDRIGMGDIIAAFRADVRERGRRP